MKKTKDSRKTVGGESLRLQSKKQESVSVVDQMRESLTDYDKNLEECINNFKKTCVNKFYVVVTTKKERLMENVIRNYFFARITCPTPDYDQIVYEITPQNDQVKFMWVIPSKDTCQYMIMNRQSLPSEEWELLGYVIKFNDGTLLRDAKKRNNEKRDSNILIN
jgi:hypothetical protein